MKNEDRSEHSSRTLPFLAFPSFLFLLFSALFSLLFISSFLLLSSPLFFFSSVLFSLKKAGSGLEDAGKTGTVGTSLSSQLLGSITSGLQALRFEHDVIMPGGES